MVSLNWAGNAHSHLVLYTEVVSQKIDEIKIKINNRQSIKTNGWKKNGTRNRKLAPKKSLDRNRCAIHLVCNSFFVHFQVFHRIVPNEHISWRHSLSEINLFLSSFCAALYVVYTFCVSAPQPHLVGYAFAICLKMISRSHNFALFNRFLDAISVDAPSWVKAYERIKTNEHLYILRTNARTQQRSTQTNTHDSLGLQLTWHETRV